jgi:hypothetical protein
MPTIPCCGPLNGLSICMSNLSYILWNKHRWRHLRSYCLAEWTPFGITVTIPYPEFQMTVKLNVCYSRCVTLNSCRMHPLGYETWRVKHLLDNIRHPRQRHKHWMSRAEISSHVALLAGQYNSEESWGRTQVRSAVVEKVCWPKD